MPNQLETYFPGVTFGAGVQIIGLNGTQIGQGSCIADHAWLNICLRDGEPRLFIGRRVLVGRNSMLSSCGRLEIGDHCLLAPRVFVSDADHVYSNIARPYMDQGATSGAVVVEENCWLGIHAVVTGSITVGRGSVIAANAVVVRDVPPFCVVAGVPARIIRMFNPETNAWESVDNEAERDRITAIRAQNSLPSRDEYRRILERTRSGDAVDPLVAGRGRCI